MQRRDEITIQKIISEMEVGIDMLGNTSLEKFLHNEMLKRALSMTSINVGELVKVVSDEVRNKIRKGDRYDRADWKSNLESEPLWRRGLVF